MDLARRLPCRLATQSLGRPDTPKEGGEHVVRRTPAGLLNQWAGFRGAWQPPAFIEALL